MRTTTILAATILLALAATHHASAATVLIEAEGFDKLGGWVVDQQFMDQMGSPIVLAHGLGIPVADATTKVQIPGPGQYRIFVRTRDWVANWQAPGAPGKFQLLIDGQPLPTTFGTEGAKWHWQSSPAINIDKRSITIALHDLTGFAGRCDAIVLTTEKDFTPPNKGPAMARFRKKLLGLPKEAPSAGKFDLVVVGGGMAGTCSAISASRLGLKVALVQDRPVLGGNNSSETRVHLGGEINLPPYPAIGDVVKEIDPGHQGNARPAEFYDDSKKLAVVKAETNITTFLNTHAYKVETSGSAITAVIGRNIVTNKELRFEAPLFADCTGDGTIGFLAGADFLMGTEGRDYANEAMAPEKPDNMTMGSSAMWYSKDTEKPSPFPDCPWALQFNEQSCQNAIRGEWNWEVGLNWDQIDEFEAVRDHAFRAIYGNWAYQKNHSANKAKYANLQLDWVAYIAGKRESRRLLGDVILKQQDIEDRKKFADALVTTTWSIDLHYPHKENSKHFPDMEFRTYCVQPKIKPYPIPYRCLYSRNIDNLFMAGRNISVTHVALGTVRVMRTTGMMGEAIGMAAAVADKHNTTPRQVFAKHLKELLAIAKKGTGHKTN